MEKERGEFLLATLTGLLLVFALWSFISLRKDYVDAITSLRKELYDFKKIQLDNLRVFDSLDDIYFSEKSYCISSEIYYDVKIKNNGEVDFYPKGDISKSDLIPQKGLWTIKGNKLFFEIRYNNSHKEFVAAKDILVNRNNMVLGFNLEETEVLLIKCD